MDPKFHWGEMHQLCIQRLHLLCVEAKPTTAGMHSDHASHHTSNAIHSCKLISVCVCVLTRCCTCHWSWGDMPSPSRKDSRTYPTPSWQNITSQLPSPPFNFMLHLLHARFCHFCFWCANNINFSTHMPTMHTE